MIPGRFSTTHTPLVFEMQGAKSRGTLRKTSLHKLSRCQAQYQIATMYITRADCPAYHLEGIARHLPHKQEATTQQESNRPSIQACRRKKLRSQFWFEGRVACELSGRNMGSPERTPLKGARMNLQTQAPTEPHNKTASFVGTACFTGHLDTQNREKCEVGRSRHCQKGPLGAWPVRQQKGMQNLDSGTGIVASSVIP